MSGIDEYAITPASNTSIATIGVSDATPPDVLDNIIRQLMADTRRAFNDIGGKAVTSGTDSVTLTTETVYTAYADGTLIGAIIGGTNTGPTTMTVDTVASKKVLKGAGAELAAGDQTAGMPALWMYDASADSATGAWLLLNPLVSVAGFQPLDADLTTLASAFTTASASGSARLALAEDTDNGAHTVTLAAPASVAASVVVTLPSAAVTLASLTGTETLTNKTLTDPAITGAILEDIFTITDGAAFEIDPSNGSLQRVVLGANRTPAATNFANGESVTLIVDDGTAATVTWTTVGVVWVGGVAPTLATSGFNIIELWKEGNVIRGVYVGSTAS
jgi:hypothetical protein